MEFVDKIIANLEKLGPYWPFFAWLFISMLIGRVMNKQIFTDAAARAERGGKWYVFWDAKWFYVWMRRTLVLHPVFAGFIIAWSWKEPSPGVDLVVERFAYFGLSGGLSVFAYELIKGIGKKFDIDVTLPGDSRTPPPPAPVPPPVPKD